MSWLPNFQGKKLFWALFLLLGINLLVWQSVFAGLIHLEPQVYFLDVGQGDSELIQVGGIKILVDGGPNGKVLGELGEILPITDRYLDLVILTHPHLDHFGGLIDILKNYEVGLFLDSGFGHQTPQYDYFAKEITAKKVRRLVLSEGDKISYKDLELKILSPFKNSRQKSVKEIHDNTIVFSLRLGNFRGLFTGDIDFDMEQRLLARHWRELAANLLKVSHHGSKFSTSAEFLKAVRPQFSIIEVGKNSYGHPAKDLLNRLAASGTKIFRTDLNGALKVELAGNQLFLFAQFLNK